MASYCCNAITGGKGTFTAFPIINNCPLFGTYEVVKLAGPIMCNPMEGASTTHKIGLKHNVADSGVHQEMMFRASRAYRGVILSARAG